MQRWGLRSSGQLLVTTHVHFPNCARADVVARGLQNYGTRNKTGGDLWEFRQLTSRRADIAEMGIRGFPLFMAPNFQRALREGKKRVVAQTLIPGSLDPARSICAENLRAFYDSIVCVSKMGPIGWNVVRPRNRDSSYLPGSPEGS